MRERPILFSAPMVRAILEGRKTQTRRVVQYRHNGPKGDGKLHPPPDYVTRWAANNGIGPEWHGEGDSPNGGSRGAGWTTCPYGKPGDRLWVREATVIHGSIREQLVGYVADGCKRTEGWEIQMPSIHMRRAHSRITLEITEVRVQRLQEIIEADAIAEGVTAADFYRWTLEAAAKTDTVPLCWIETPKGSSDHDYCRTCADKKLKEIVEARGDGTDCFVNGGWNGFEADGPRFCETCGVTLEVSLTDYAVGEELSHFKMHGGGPIGTYELNRLAGAINGEEQEREFAKIGYRWLWDSINGEGSWDANPWVWALTFKRIGSEKAEVAA